MEENIPAGMGLSSGGTAFEDSSTPMQPENWVPLDDLEWDPTFEMDPAWDHLMLSNVPNGDTDIEEDRRAYTRPNETDEGEDSSTLETSERL